MRRAIAMACVLAMMPGGVWAQQADPHANPHVPPSQQKTVTEVPKEKKRAALKKKQKAVAPPAQLPAQTMPPVPATLMNSAPVKPKVTMESGLLTIDAPNSTLSDVLSGVQKATGAAIEGASPTERVVVRLGPGDPEQVIAALLRGTAYDYVILGALGRRDVVTRVLLTQTSGGGQSGPGGSGAGQSRPPIAVHQPPSEEDQPERTVPEDVTAQPNPEADQAQPPQPQPPQQPQRNPDQPVRQQPQSEQAPQPQ